MHLVQRYVKGQAMDDIALSQPPFGAGFTKDQVTDADYLEHWGSSFNDKGPDFNEFRLFKNDELIETKTVQGY
jgi:hypothetical protein